MCPTLAWVCPALAWVCPALAGVCLTLACVCVSQVLEWLQEENLRSTEPSPEPSHEPSLEPCRCWSGFKRRTCGRTRPSSCTTASTLLPMYVAWIARRLARIGRLLARIGRRLARIRCQLARIGRRLEENLRSYAPIFVHHRLDSLAYVRKTGSRCRVWVWGSG